VLCDFRRLFFKVDTAFSTFSGGGGGGGGGGGPIPLI